MRLSICRRMARSAIERFPSYQSAAQRSSTARLRSSRLNVTRLSLLNVVSCMRRVWIAVHALAWEKAGVWPAVHRFYGPLYHIL